MARLDDSLSGTGKVMISKRIARTREGGITGSQTLSNKYSNYVRHLLDISEWENVLTESICMVTSMPFFNELVLEDGRSVSCMRQLRKEGLIAKHDR